MDVLFAYQFYYERIVIKGNVWTIFFLQMLLNLKIGLSLRFLNKHYKSYINSRYLKTSLHFIKMMKPLEVFILFHKIKIPGRLPKTFNERQDSDILKGEM